jgi:hypothetical protein
VPALGERLHGCLAGWLVAVGGCAVFVVAVGEGPARYSRPKEDCREADFPLTEASHKMGAGGY